MLVHGDNNVSRPRRHGHTARGAPAGHGLAAAAALTGVGTDGSTFVCLALRQLEELSASYLGGLGRCGEPRQLRRAVAERWVGRHDPHARAAQKVSRCRGPLAAGALEAPRRFF